MGFWTFGFTDVRGSGFLDVRGSDVRGPFSDVRGSFEPILVFGRSGFRMFGVRGFWTFRVWTFGVHFWTFGVPLTRFWFSDVRGFGRSGFQMLGIRVFGRSGFRRSGSIFGRSGFF